MWWEVPLLALGWVILSRNPIQRKREFLFIHQSHIPIGFQISGTGQAQVHLVDYYVAVTVDLHLFVPEKLGVEFNKLKQGQKAGILTFVKITLELGTKGYSQLRNKKANHPFVPIP